MPNEIEWRLIFGFAFNLIYCFLFNLIYFLGDSVVFTFIVFAWWRKKNGGWQGCNCNCKCKCRCRCSIYFILFFILYSAVLFVVLICCTCGEINILKSTDIYFYVRRKDSGMYICMYIYIFNVYSYPNLISLIFYDVPIKRLKECVGNFDRR